MESVESYFPHDTKVWDLFFGFIAQNCTGNRRTGEHGLQDIKGACRVKEIFARENGRHATDPAGSLHKRHQLQLSARLFNLKNSGEQYDGR
jgi:hypothetical protein